MKTRETFRAARVAEFLLLILVFFQASRARPTDRPLSKDDITLLLIGGATSEKMLALIEQRGIDFRMTPDLAKKFHDDGASDEVIEALQKAGEKLQPSAPSEEPASRKATTIEEKIAAAIPSVSNANPPAPNFSLVDLSGRSFSLADYKGKVVLLDFWATWCGPCRGEIPRFVELQNRFRDQGFQVIGVAVDDSVRSVRRFYENYGMNYRVAMCDSNVRGLYGGLRGIPTTLLIGRDGRIFARLRGAPSDLDWFDRSVQMLLSLTPGRKDASLAKAGDHPEIGRTPAGARKAPADSPSGGTTSTEEASAANPEPKPTPAVDLSDPALDRIQQIIQEFTAKETLFRQARNNYTYHQSNKVEEYGPDGEIDGVYQQDWDILFDDSGKRLEHVTYAPQDTLKLLLLTPEDMENFRSIQPFVLTTEELPEYEIKYLGHVKVDEITAYVFSIRPKEIKKGRLYFQGHAWVDDRDLQIVKTEGKTVPEIKTKKGENLFPRFTTYREQIDGKFWFPTFTMADDTLYFPNGPAVHMKEIIRYSDYKQFKSKVRILSVSPADQPANPTVKPK